MTKKVLMIDPPSGWKYGFPKEVPDPKPDNMLKWLVENGYPQKEIDACGKYFYSRYWEQEVEDVQEWSCRINDPNSKENCGNYECGN